MLTYYSATARADFWTEHWGGHTATGSRLWPRTPTIPCGAWGGRRGWPRGLARQALYRAPALRLLGHMLLVVARRA
jgi:hypothetical protein